MNLDETVMMIRAICSSEKGPTPFRQLSNDFKSMTGTAIPFKNLGFNSIMEFLESQPDKFKITTDKFTNEPAVQPVIDSELSSLRSLVSGQKSKKKKKPVKNNPRYRPFQGYRQFYNPKPFYGRMKDKSPQHFHSNSPVQTAKSVRFDPNIKCSEFELPMPSKISQDLIDSLTISNAAYFLNEHQVFITHVLDCEHIYIRLVSENFSENYDKMFRKMNEFYIKSRKMPPSYLDKDNVCVAFNGLKYLRVQIKNVDADQTECFHLDEGNSKIYSINHLYEIDEQFLTVKFQAIKAKMEKFDVFCQNLYLQGQIKKEICNKKFIARKTQSNPLKINLFNSENKCINDQLMQNFNIFIKYRPIQDLFIETAITYIDLESKLIYLENPENQFFTLYSHQLNNFFNDENNKSRLRSLNQEAKLKIFSDCFNNDEIFCARYSVDSNWYRVKYIREKKQTNEFFVLFVDFGNKDFVGLDELCVLPEHFALFKSLPHQCFPCTLLSTSSKYDYFKSLWFDNVQCKFKIIHINPTGIPTIELIGTINEEPIMVNTLSPIENQIVEYFDKINLNNNNQVESPVDDQSQDDDVVTINKFDLKEANMPSKAFVCFKYVNNPFDFVINLVCLSKFLEELRENMKNFYKKKSEKYQVDSLTKNCIYVYQNEDLECFRVQFCGKIHNYAKVFFIDYGYYDAVKIKNLFLITKKFSELQSMAIKAKLANIKCKQGNVWSKEAKNFFYQLADKEKVFETSIIKFVSEENYFEIEMTERSIGSLSNAMVRAKYALPTN